MTVQDSTGTDTAAGTAAFVAEWEKWHHDKDTAFAHEHGFLAVTGLHWPTSEPQRFPGAPGVWSAGDDGVTVELDDGEELVVDGATVRGRHHFGVLAERASVNAVWGDAVIEVARRGGQDVVRPRHPDHPLRTAFTGTPAYAPDPRWRLTGTYVPFPEPRPTTVGAAVEGLEHVYDAPGKVRFATDGQELELTAFEGGAPGALLVLFTDATSGVTTYAANRALKIDAPGPDGQVVLDFNRATNLPCAYTDFATCPLPPAENRLPVAIEAGETIPYERRSAAA
ncbi:DUF1684 domain-containing protein [Streptomyces pseudogriseolus]|uniref:DUF1684 domain-containing protein n=1 Tax=Streptomyces pseudogriseolus TaxID=36817 RepID=UPI003FA1B2F9|nr:DUF1684 domain-containing protein [Streptomyces pseudogriseolus]